MLNIDIDTGGTMTDGLVSGEGDPFSVKVETTPHDVTIAFMDILEAVREKVGAPSLRALLDRVALIRWSSTITSNVLAQKSGPKLGLLVSAGHEDDLYTTAENAATVLDALVARENVTGITDDADDADVRIAVKQLFDRGIRRINISLAGSFPDNSRERKIVSMIDQQYPDHFLGSIPALGAGDILQRPDDATRTFVSLINAYVHPSLATTLYRAEEIVRQEHGWRGNVLVGHINGGVARIGKTTAFDTIESGPLFGTHATAHEARKGGVAKVLAIDVGGTTAKASLVDHGRVADLEQGNLFGIPLKMNLPLLRSIALGGGSVARVGAGVGGGSNTAVGGGRNTARVRLGPDSMGAAPGPACYGLGGRNATITDAFVVLGLVDPDGFLNGRRVLDVDKARDALDRNVASKLGMSIEDGARAVMDAAFDAVADLARETAAEEGWDPSETAIYAFGGNGPLFATGVAERLGSTSVKLFRFGNVLSAYGSAISDVVHVYEAAVPGTDPESAARKTADDLKDEAVRDLRGEGFDIETAEFAWEVRGPNGELTTATGEIDSALTITPTLVKLRASCPLPSVEFTATSAPNPDPRPSASRPSALDASGSLRAYAYGDLAGATVPGPALVDGDSFTWLIGDGWSASIDDRGDAAVSRKELQAAGTTAKEANR